METVINVPGETPRTVDVRKLIPGLVREATQEIRFWIGPYAAFEAAKGPQKAEAPEYYQLRIKAIADRLRV